MASRNLVSALYDLIARDLNQGDGLGVTRLETYRSSGWDVQTISMRPNAIELQLWVCLDEVVMRSNLGALSMIWWFRTFCRDGLPV